MEHISTSARQFQSSSSSLEFLFSYSQGKQGVAIVGEHKPSVYLQRGRRPFDSREHQNQIICRQFKDWLHLDQYQWHPALHSWKTASKHWRIPSKAGIWNSHSENATPLVHNISSSTKNMLIASLHQRSLKSEPVTTRLLVSGWSSECSDCFLRSMEH